MRVQRVPHDPGGVAYALLDDADQPIPEVAAFLRHLAARDCSPNTLAAYAYDLLHFFQFLARQQLTLHQFTAVHALALLEYLRQVPSRRRAQRLDLVLCTTDAGHAATRLAPATINRIISAISSFYEFLIVSGHRVALH